MKVLRNRQLCVSRLLFGLCMGILISSPSWAQSSTLLGRVIDQSGAVVRDAEIKLTAEETGQVQGTKTSQDGLYRFPFIRSGKYTVTASASGFKGYEKSQITVETAQNVALDIRLELGDTSQTISVDGSGIHLNTLDASVSTLVNRQFVDNIPMNGRSFQSLITLVPGVNLVPSGGAGYEGEFSVNGQRTESNYFTVDGVSANTGAPMNRNAGNGGGYAGATPSYTVMGTTQSLVSLDALEEFRATTSTYAAEYGRTPGGQFSFTTRSGTNAYHGSLFDYFRNDKLDANAWFSNASRIGRIPKRQNDFGGTLGGPVYIPGLYNGKDRTFFFVSYEGLRLRLPQEAQRITVPSVALRQAVPDKLKPFLNAFPIPNGNDLGSGGSEYVFAYSSPSSLDTTSIRLDHRLGNRATLFGRYSHAPSSSLSRNSNPALVGSRVSRVRTLTAGSTQIFSPRVSNDLRFNTTWNDSNSGSALEAFGGAVPFATRDVSGLGNSDNNSYTFMVSMPGAFFLMQPGRGSIDQKQYNLVNSLSVSLGRHVLKFGVDYRRVSNYQFTSPVSYFAYYPSMESLMNNTPTNGANGVSVGKSLLPIQPVYSNFSAFVQDEWRVAPRLSLSLGLRWDVNPPPNDSVNQIRAITTTDLRTVELKPEGAPLWNTYYRGFAPRIGIAYQMNQASGFETILRAGAGLFYDLGNSAASDGYTFGVKGTQADKAYPPSAGFPLTQEEVDSVVAEKVEAPYKGVVYGFDPNLKLPRTWQWNIAIEQRLGSHQSLTMNYVASAGRRLIMTRRLRPESFDNWRFSNGSGLQLTSNQASSDYHSLQVQFQRRLARGLQAMAAYTWAHSIDDVSSNWLVQARLRSSSNFDIRHNFQSAFTYEVPGTYNHRIASALLKNWVIEGRISARTALPLDITGRTGLDAATGANVTYRPNRVAGEPLYISGNSFPGGRRLNPEAYVLAPEGVEGTAGRNSARGFGNFQTDIALRRDFVLNERFRLQLKGEAFNVANHPMFGSVGTNMNTPTQFGLATNTLNQNLGGLNPLYQIGGPRSMQIMLRMQF